MYTRTSLAWGALSATLFLSGCSRDVPTKHTHAQLVMGTEARVTAIALGATRARAAVSAGYALIEQVNALMSDYIAESEVGRINRLAAEESLVVSPLTFFCLYEARKVSEQSGGAFDITCRPLVWLWREAGKTQQWPGEDALSAARARVGWQKLTLDPATRAVRPLVAGLQIDLGGIAKGYALDLAADAMRAAGATGGLVDIGGDVLAFGSQANGEPWRIGVRDPFAPGREVLLTLAVQDRAVATSGVQERFIEIAGERYSHIIDPRSGQPAAQSPSVTVIAKDGLTADAWATVLSVMSVEEGQELLRQPHAPELEVLWFVRTGDEVRTEQTQGFAQFLQVK
ncbi:MAG: FAD:protein FMN transferase [Phycisphaerales bacterium]|nr:FAD:protein FMN transferase [Phycisphaerales bacterium]